MAHFVKSSFITLHTFLFFLEVLRIKKLHKRELSALKQMYEGHIEELTKKHRDDLIAVSKVVTSLTGDLKKALGAVGLAVELVNKFQVRCCPATRRNRFH